VPAIVEAKHLLFQIAVKANNSSKASCSSAKLFSPLFQPKSHVKPPNHLTNSKSTTSEDMNIFGTPKFARIEGVTGNNVRLKLGRRMSESGQPVVKRDRDDPKVPYMLCK
jgi:hypothetical protein